MNQRNLYTGKRFRDALRAFILGRAIQGIANVIFVLLIIRLMRPADYGAYMALWGIVEMLVPLSSLGLLEATRRFLPDLATRGSAEGVRSFVKWTTLARFTILFAWAGAIALGWPVLTAWLGFSTMQIEQAWIGVALVVSVLGFRYAAEMLETLLEQRWSQLAHALLPIGRLLGVVLLVSVGTVSLAKLLWVDLIVSLFCLLLAEWALVRRLRTLDAAGEYRVSVREVVGFAWHMAGVNILSAIASVGALRLLAARLLGLEAMGLFAFLQQLTTIVSRYMPAQLLANIIRPMMIARRAAGETDVVGQGVGLMWKSNLLIVLAGMAVLAVGGDEIIRLASGGRFEQAGLVMLVLFLGLGANSQGLLINMAMQIHDRTRELRSQSLLFIFVPIAAWAGGQLGLTGFVAGIVVAQWLRNGVALWWMRRYGIDIVLDVPGLARVMALTVLAVAPVWFFGEQLGVWLALFLTVLLLLGAFLLARPLSRADESIAGRILKGKARFLKPFVYAG